MSRIRPEDLVRQSYRRMDLYVSNRRPAAIDLSDNTNLAGVPPTARRVAVEAVTSGDAMARYPSHYGSELKRAIADYLRVDATQIVTGCGSDDVLDSAIRAFTDAGDRIAYPDPTFAMLPYFAHMNGLEPCPVPLLGADRGYDIDAEALIGADAKVIYLCSPNNPTGTLASPASVERVIEHARGLVIADEAYVDYGGATLVGRAAAEGRLLVVRTLSKAFGLAGQRIGYAVGAPTLVSEVEKSRGPYKVTALGEHMAVAALDHDRAWVAARISDVLESRATFEQWLRARGMRPLPSAANFVLVPVPGAAELAVQLRERGVAVRAFSQLRGIGDALRISVGPWSIMLTALPAFEEVLPCA